MLDFIYEGSVDLFGTGKERKFKMKIYVSSGTVIVALDPRSINHTRPCIFIAQYSFNRFWYLHRAEMTPNNSCRISKPQANAMETADV